MTQAQVEKWLRDTPLQGHGAAFYQAGRKYRVDPRLLVAISGAESSYGRVQSGNHNPFGWGPGIDFPSYAAAAEAVAKGLRTNYLDKGLRTIPQIGSKYAPAGADNDPTNLNSNWVRNVSKFYRELGGKNPGTNPDTNPDTSASPPAATPSMAPDLASFAMQNLSEISAGRFSPQEALSRLPLAASVPSGGTGVPGGTAASSASPDYGPVEGGITYSGQKLTHETSGLGGYPAVDLFANPGTPFKAPEPGKVVRHSGRGGTKGGYYGYSVYFQGDSGRKYYIQHLNRQRAPRGRYKQGAVLGTVSPWDGGAPHAHVGVRS